MGPKPLGESGETGKFPRPQEAPLQQLGAEARATASRTGEGTLFGRAWGMVWAVTLSTSRTEQGSIREAPLCLHEGQAQVCHYKPHRQHVHGPAGFQPPGALRELVPKGELISGPIRGTPTADGFSGLEDLGLARRETDV